MIYNKYFIQNKINIDF